MDKIKQNGIETIIMKNVKSEHIFLGIEHFGRRVVYIIYITTAKKKGDKKNLLTSWLTDHSFYCKQTMI